MDAMFIQHNCIPVIKILAIKIALNDHYNGVDFHSSLVFKG